MPRVAVIGAGIVGCCIALTLRKRGANVTLIDRDEPGRGCSFGNSGAISPGSVAPLAMPGVLTTLPGMLLDAESPLRLPWRHLARAAPWLLRFVASAAPSSVAGNAQRLAALHAGAVAKHRALTQEIGVPELFVQRGHLHLYPDRDALAKDTASWDLRKRYGVHFEPLERDGIVALEPRVGRRYQVGVFVADHATIVDPYRYVQAIAAAFARGGGAVRRSDVQSVRPVGNRQWRLAAGDGGAVDGVDADPFDHVVVAAGAWSRRLLDPLGIRLPLESQRGYHVQFLGGRETVSRTVILADRKVFLAPMEQGLRIGGTVEIGGLVRPPDPRRNRLLERIARETFDGLDGLGTVPWMGHRPCMPDSVPVIGQAANRLGLWLAVGHGHLGLTDSIPTAERIADGMFGVSSNATAQGEPSGA